MSERAIVFGCAGEDLLGVLHEPPTTSGKPSTMAVLVIVGGPQYRVGSHRQFVLMARSLAEQGYPVLRFDYRGMGDSSGDSRSFESINDDIRAALDLLVREVPGLRGVCLFGLCDAASAALMYCSCEDRRVQALVIANPWVRTDSGQAKAIVQHYYGRRIFHKSFWAKVMRGNFNVTRGVADLLQSWRRSRASAVQGGFISRMLEGLRGFAGPALLLLSEHDLTAREFEALVAGSNEWKTAMKVANFRTLVLSGTDHTFSDEEGLMTANAAIVPFLDRARSGRGMRTSAQ